MSEPVFVGKPMPACSKCGHMYGFLWSAPTWRTNAISVAMAGRGTKPREWLEWSCRYCGWTVKTATADAADASSPVPQEAE